jgi:hypothetical protein
MVTLPSELFKFATITPLQDQVARLDVCGKCHTKTLVHRITNEIGRCMQCTKCLTVWILDCSSPNTRASHEP